MKRMIAKWGSESVHVLAFVAAPEYTNVGGATGVTVAKPTMMAIVLMSTGKLRDVPITELEIQQSAQQVTMKRDTVYEPHLRCSRCGQMPDQPCGSEGGILDETCPRDVRNTPLTEVPEAPTPAADNNRCPRCNAREGDLCNSIKSKSCPDGWPRHKRCAH